VGEFPEAAAGLGLDPARQRFALGLGQPDVGKRGQRPIESTEQLSAAARAGEIAAFGLRMPAGWRFSEFKQATGFDLRREWAAEMQDLENKGWGVVSDARFHLTPTGLRFADSAAELFLR